MVTASAIPLGLALGLLLGGRLGRLAELRIRGVWLFYLALALQLAAFPSGLFPWTVGEGLSQGLWLASYGCLVVAALANLCVTGAPIVGAGMLANLVAILANGGEMPMTESARIGAGVGLHEVANNSVAAADPQLPWLVDRFAAPSWVPVAHVFSVGDVLIIAGIVVLLTAAMGPRVRARSRAAAISG